MPKNKPYPKAAGGMKSPFKHAPKQQEGKTNTKTPKVFRGRAVHFNPKVRM